MGRTRKPKIVHEDVYVKNLVIESKKAPAKISTLWTIVITIGLLILAFILITNRWAGKAEATFHRDWSNWSRWGNWSTCEPQELKRTLEVVEIKECGTFDGTQSRERTRECEWKLGGGANHCSIGQIDKDYEHRGCKIEIPCPSPTPEITPEVTPEVTPTPAPCTSNCGNPPTFAGSSTEPPQCGSKNITEGVVNPHVYRNGDKAVVKWWGTQGNLAHIFYRQVGISNWQYSVTVPNNGYAEINGLDSMDIEFAVMQADGCGGGVSVMSKVIVDGPSNHWVLYR
jgi:hypothetical protein